MGEWRRTTLGQMLALQRGYDLTDQQRTPGKFPVMGAAGQNGYHGEYRVEGPGIVVGRSGGSYGEVHFVGCDFWPHNTALFVSDFKGNNAEFVYYFLSSLDFKSLNSGSAQPSLNRNYVYPLKITIPGIVEQQKIAAVLSALDAKIDLNQRINAELEALARTLYDYWFLQFDFPDVRGRPYRASGGRMVWNDTLQREIPQGWGSANITAVAEILGGATPRKRRPEYWNGDIPFFTPTDAGGEVFQLDTEDTITQAGLASCSSGLFDKGTIFITARGSVGKIAIAGCPMAMNQSCYALRPKVAGTHPFVWLQAQDLIEHLKVKASGSTFNSIVTNDILWTQLAAPDPDVVLKFSKTVSGVFDRIESAQRENRQLVQLRDWLLPLLMSGQVRVA